jgi:hypothetical protein
VRTSRASVPTPHERRSVCRARRPAVVVGRRTAQPEVQTASIDPAVRNTGDDDRRAGQHQEQRVSHDAGKPCPLRAEWAK